MRFIEDIKQFIDQISGSSALYYLSKLKHQLTEIIKYLDERIEVVKKAPFDGPDLYDGFRYKGELALIAFNLGPTAINCSKDDFKQGPIAFDIPPAAKSKFDVMFINDAKEHYNRLGKLSEMFHLPKEIMDDMVQLRVITETYCDSIESYGDLRSDASNEWTDRMTLTVKDDEGTSAVYSLKYRLRIVNR